MTNQDINVLYQLTCDGGPRQEEDLFKALLARFRVFALQRIWNEHDAEEVVQNALATILGEYKSMTFSASFAAWAYKILDYRIMAYIQDRRRDKRRDQLNEEMAVTAASSAKPEPEDDIKQVLLDCLKKIGGANIRYARILNLHYQGYSTSEICGSLGISSTNFYTILSRARSLLEYCLEKGEIKP